VIRRGHKRAIIAVAHKILEVSYTLLKRHEPYKDPGTDYREQMVHKNAPRWLKALQEFGYLEKMT
jgi:transposase